MSLFNLKLLLLQSLLSLTNGSQDKVAHRLKNSTHHLNPKFNALAISVAREERKEWSRNLTFQLEEIHDKYGLKADFFAEKHRIFDVVGPVSPLCPHGQLESYGKGDEEKRVCGLSSSLDAYHNSESCVVYSIGSNNQWGFEEEIVKRTNCTVETFDCTLEADILPPAAIQHRVRLHKVCLGSHDGTINSKEFRTYKSLHKLTGISHSPTFLKMDIEGYEFHVLKNIVNSKQHLPDQIAFELYGLTFQKGLSWVSRVYKTTGEIATFMDFLWRFGGYYLIDRRDNNDCGFCSELLIARVLTNENE